MCPNEKKDSKSLRFTYVSKVITEFEYFQPRFAQGLVLSLEWVVLDPQFNSLSNGIGLGVGHW